MPLSLVSPRQRYRIFGNRAEQKGFTSEEAAWCDDMGHGIGLWLYEYPVINRLWSLDHPQTLEEGMTIAIEALDPVDPALGRIKVEEMVVVTKNGVRDSQRNTE